MGESKRYSVVAMLFHWAIAIAVLFNMWLVNAAQAAEAIGDEAADTAFMNDHKALGITILMLTVLRLGWRLTHRPPPLPEGYPVWEKVLARTVHVLFYTLLIGLPLGGWLGISQFGAGIDLWGVMALPALPVGADPETGSAIIDFHRLGAKIMLALLALHVLGALKHMVVDKDGNLWRMLPFGTPK